MKDFSALRRRYAQEPSEIQVGALASNLSRIAWFMQRPDTRDKLEPIFRESKYFTEWAAESVPLELQSMLAEVQIELALWQRRLTQADLPPTLPAEPEMWSQRLLKAANLVG